MRALLAIGLIAALGAAALGVAWNVLGKVPASRAASPEAPAVAQERADGALHEPQRVEAREESAADEGDTLAARAPVGLEEGGAAPLVRDYAAIYAERSTAERRAAAERLRGEIEVARAALGPAELDELAGRRGNQPTTPGVARLLALIEERTWVLASLAREPAAAPGDEP